MSKLSFDASKVAPQAPREIIPAGWYNAKFIESEVRPTKGEGGTLINFTAEIIDGEHAGVKVYDNVNIKNKSAKAQEIGQAQLSAICHATGVIQLKDTEALHGVPFLLQVKVEQARTVGDTTYEASNRFGGFKPAEGGPVASTAAKAPAWASKGPKTPAAPATPAAPVKKAREPDLREFYVHLDGANEEKTGDEIATMLKEGMPEDTPVVLQGETDWQTAAAYEIASIEDEAAAPAAPAAKGPAAPPSKAAAGSKTPPWKR